jgi:hypothetical protein
MWVKFFVRILSHWNRYRKRLELIYRGNLKRLITSASNESSNHISSVHRKRGFAPRRARHKTPERWFSRREAPWKPSFGRMEKHFRSTNHRYSCSSSLVHQLLTIFCQLQSDLGFLTWKVIENILNVFIKTAKFVTAFHLSKLSTRYSGYFFRECWLFQVQNTWNNQHSLKKVWTNAVDRWPV